MLQPDPSKRRPVTKEIKRRKTKDTRKILKLWTEKSAIRVRLLSFPGQSVLDGDVEEKKPWVH
jgi:hypothetical protein